MSTAYSQLGESEAAPMPMPPLLPAPPRAADLPDALFQAEAPAAASPASTAPSMPPAAPHASGLPDALFQTDASPPMSAVGFVTFARTYARRLDDNDASLGKETFPQTLARVLRACNTQLGVGFTEDEAREAFLLMHDLKFSTAGRFLWQLGTRTVDKYGLLSLQNCAACVVDDPIEPFVWAMDALMLGSGVGFRVLPADVAKLPPVCAATITRIDTPERDGRSADFIVPDTREGWIELLRRTLKAHFRGGDRDRSFTFSLQLIRNKGVAIKGFGGESSGPEVLAEGIRDINAVLNGYAARDQCVACARGSLVSELDAAMRNYSLVSVGLCETSDVTPDMVSAEARVFAAMSALGYPEHPKGGDAHFMAEGGGDVRNAAVITTFWVAATREICTSAPPCADAAPADRCAACAACAAAGPQACTACAHAGDAKLARNRLDAVGALDVMNLIGRIVVSGNVRRSAEIAIGSATDDAYLDAKNWASGKVPNYRCHSNNSVAADDMADVPEKVWKGYDGSGEPYGFINLPLSRACGRLGETQYPDPDVVAYNPCAEQSLANYETCCLAELFLPHMESQAQMIRCALIAYRICKHSLLLPCHQKATEAVVHANMRMGIGLTGVAQASEEQLSWMSPTYEALRAFDCEYSAKLGVPTSVKLTTVKPSGTMSLVGGTTSGVNPGWARHYIRRIRFAAGHPLVAAARASGHKVEFARGFDGAEDHATEIVEFPCAVPEGARVAADVTAVDQLELVKRLQTEWSDNAVSCTVVYRLEELPAIRAWLGENYKDSVKTVSFLLHQNHGFQQAPFEEITEEAYHEAVARCGDLRAAAAAAVYTQADVDGEKATLASDCAGGACPVR